MSESFWGGIIAIALLWMMCSGKPSNSPNVCERSEGKSWNSSTIVAKTGCEVVGPAVVSAVTVLGDFYAPEERDKL